MPQANTTTVPAGAKRELLDVRTDEVSLVDRAANAHEFELIKNASGKKPVPAADGGAPVVKAAVPVSTSVGADESGQNTPIGQLGNAAAPVTTALFQEKVKAFVAAAQGLAADVTNLTLEQIQQKTWSLRDLVWDLTDLAPDVQATLSKRMDVAKAAGDVGGFMDACIDATTEFKKAVAAKAKVPAVCKTCGGKPTDGVCKECGAKPVAKADPTEQAAPPAPPVVNDAPPVYPKRLTKGRITKLQGILKAMNDFMQEAGVDLAGMLDDAPADEPADTTVAKAATVVVAPAVDPVLAKRLEDTEAALAKVQAESEAIKKRLETAGVPRDLGSDAVGDGGAPVVKAAPKSKWDGVI